jgi:hypothetical protein
MDHQGGNESETELKVKLRLKNKKGSQVDKATNGPLACRKKKNERWKKEKKNWIEKKKPRQMKGPH